MSDWRRITQEVPFNRWSTEMVEAVNNHIELYRLGPIVSDALMGIQTDSERIKKGLFGKTEMVHQGVIVTPYWLVWVVESGNNKAVALSARLADVVVQDYAQTQFAKMIPDSGIQVTGRFTDASENASAFIGLDDEAAGKRFKEIIIKAVQDAKK